MHKRKLPELNGSYNNELSSKRVQTSKPSAIFKPTGGRDHTLSIGIPGSIIANALTHDAKTALASTIARCASVFCVDEIVIFNDGTTPPQKQDGNHAEADAASGYTAYSDPDHFLAHVLSYLETPPYLRRSLFPHQPNLKTAGSMPGLDMPHHLRKEDWCRYREGVVERSFSSSSKHKSYSIVDVGLNRRVRVEGEIPEGARLTVDLGFREELNCQESQEGEYYGEALAPSEPREREGYYWGYTIRRATSLSRMLTECPFEGGYDFCVGTSERGIPIQGFTHRNEGAQGWKHLLVCFGGIAGLEVAVENDPELKDKVEDPSELFDAYLNLVPSQGSRTIRTEEAIWCGCMGLKGWIEKRSKNTAETSKGLVSRTGNGAMAIPDIPSANGTSESFESPGSVETKPKKKKNRHKRQ